MDWMLLPLRRYAEFSGRSRPKEYWMFALFVFLVSLAALIVDMLLGFGDAVSGSTKAPGFWAGWAAAGGGGPLTLIVSLAMLVPGLAVTIRRLHDSDRSGWWILIAFVPLVGFLALMVFMILGGTRGPNRFGSDPLEGA